MAPGSREPGRCSEGGAAGEAQRRRGSPGAAALMRLGGDEGLREAKRSGGRDP
jgi:hypothetical protein